MRPPCRTFRALGFVAVSAAVVACGGSSTTAGGSNDNGGSKGTAPGTGNTTSAGGTSGNPGGGDPDTGGTVSTSEAVPVTIGNCPPFTPCGGNLVGRWRVASICASDTSGLDASGLLSILPPCATQNAVEEAKSSVVLDFAADGSYVASGSVTVVLDLPFDDACTMSAFMQDAASACTLLAALAPQASAQGQATCALKNGICDCQFVSTPTVTDQAGTYVVGADGVTLNYVTTNADGTTTPGMETDAFCASGGTVTVQSSSLAQGASVTLEPY